LATPADIVYTDTRFDDTFATVNGNLVATDANGNSLTYGIQGGSDLGNGTVRLVNNFGTLTVTKATGAYSFVANDATIEALIANSVTNFTVTVSDGLLSTSKTLTLRINQSGVTESNGKDNLVGTAGNDKFNALAGDDTINGGAGADTMVGGLGKDIFQLTTLTRDRITDFNVADDTIQLENGVFTKLTATGGLSVNSFKIGAATDADDFILYNNATGILTYDSNGNGAGGATQIAVLGVGLGLTHLDFGVI
jgi:Ca2+-binding RTX toxin-like protein